MNTYKVSKADFITDYRKQKKEKTWKLKQALNAVHVNLQVTDAIVNITDDKERILMVDGEKLEIGQDIKAFGVRKVKDCPNMSLPLMTFLPFTKEDLPNSINKKA
jgi:hypothetical protein